MEATSKRLLRKTIHVESAFPAARVAESRLPLFQETKKIRVRPSKKGESAHRGKKKNHRLTTENRKRGRPGTLQKVNTGKERSRDPLSLRQKRTSQVGKGPRSRQKRTGTGGKNLRGGWTKGEMQGESADLNPTPRRKRGKNWNRNSCSRKKKDQAHKPREQPSPPKREKLPKGKKITCTIQPSLRYATKNEGKKNLGCAGEGKGVRRHGGQATRD